MDKRLLGVSVRKWQNNARDFEKSIAAVCDYMSEKYGFYPVFIPMQHERDMAISRNIVRLMKKEASVLDKNYSVEEIMSIFACMDMCIGMRLHSLIYSASQAVPVIGISYDPKITGFMKDMHQNFYVNAESLNENELIELVDLCMSEYDTVRAELKEYGAVLKEKSAQNGAMAVELYENN